MKKHSSLPPWYMNFTYKKFNLHFRNLRSQTVKYVLNGTQRCDSRDYSIQGGTYKRPWKESNKQSINRENMHAQCILEPIKRIHYWLGLLWIPRSTSTACVTEINQGRCRPSLVRVWNNARTLSRFCLFTHRHPGVLDTLVTQDVTTPIKMAAAPFFDSHVHRIVASIAAESVAVISSQWINLAYSPLRS